MAEKIYVPKVSVKTGKYGLRLSGNAEAVIEHIKQHTNAKGYFNWDINPRKEEGKYGETHTVTVNTWQPETDNSATVAANQQRAKEESHQTSGSNDSDLPFALIAIFTTSLLSYIVF